MSQGNASPPAIPVARMSRFTALRLARRFRIASMQRCHDNQLAGRESAAAGLCVADLLALHGSSSMGGVLLFWGLFSQLPVGGVGNVAGVALCWLAWAWWRGKPDPPLPRRFLQARLSPAWSLRMLRCLAAVYRRAGRWLRPRWMPQKATQGDFRSCFRLAWATWIALQAVVIFLPLPMGNLLPGLSLMALGLGQQLEDGAMYLASLGLGVLGLAYTAWLGEAVWAWAHPAWSWLVGWL